MYRLLKSERVSERNKQRIKLKEFGYLGLVCFLEDIPVTMVTVQCLYGQVLATGTVGPPRRWKRWDLLTTMLKPSFKLLCEDGS